MLSAGAHRTAGIMDKWRWIQNCIFVNTNQIESLGGAKSRQSGATSRHAGVKRIRGTNTGKYEVLMEKRGDT